MGERAPSPPKSVDKYLYTADPENLAKILPDVSNPNTQAIRDFYNGMYWTEYQDHRRQQALNWSNRMNRLKPSADTTEYLRRVTDNPFEIDPLVKYRMIGKGAIDELDAIGILSGPIPNKDAIISAGKGPPKAPSLFFSQGMPLFQYGHGQLQGTGTAINPENPYLIGTVGQDSSWFPRELVERGKSAEWTSKFIDGDRHKLNQYNRKVGDFLMNAPQDEIQGYLQKFLAGDTDVMNRITNGTATADEIASVFGTPAYYGWGGGNKGEYDRYLDYIAGGTHLRNRAGFANWRSIDDIKPSRGWEMGAMDTEKVAFTKNLIPASLDLNKRPFAIWEYGPNGFQLINEGNNKPLFNGVKPVPTAPISESQMEEFKAPYFTRGPDGQLFIKGDASLAKWFDAQHTTVGKSLEQSQSFHDKYFKGKNNPNLRRGFINPKMLGSDLATELTTLTPYEAGVLNISKDPKLAVDFAKFAKANPAFVANQTLNTLGRLGAVASIAMAPSEAISRRDKLVYDFYSKPENQRLSKDEESKINTYLGVRAGLENAVNAGTMGLYDYATTPEGTEAYQQHNDSMNLYRSTGGLPLGY